MGQVPGTQPADCVGALIRDGSNRVYVQRRSPQRKLLPGAWDIVGGHVEDGENVPRALAREVAEETGWQLRRIEALVADWKWQHDGVVRREFDYLIEVDGDLSRPRLESAKHDSWYWVSFRDIDFIRQAQGCGNAPLWNIIAKATRIRLTRELRMEPIDADSGGSLWAVHRDGGRTLCGREAGREETAEMAQKAEDDWDNSLGYWWLFYQRGNRSDSRAIGYGGLSYEKVGEYEELVLHCSVPIGPRDLDCAEQVAEAILAFAHTELGAHRVTACTEPGNFWAHSLLDRLGMKHVGELRRGPASYQLYDILISRGSSYDIEQEVVTGIGQIMAIPPS